jgi:cytochrome oxidase Cu insertion factor (SCO1/SenC/PrrC family)
MNGNTVLIPAIILGYLLAATPARGDVEIGLPQGQSAPNFELTDQNGESHSLTSLLADGPLAILFFRSADW